MQIEGREPTLNDSQLSTTHGETHSLPFFLLPLPFPYFFFSLAIFLQTNGHFVVVKFKIEKKMNHNVSLTD